MNQNCWKENDPGGTVSIIKNLYEVIMIKAEDTHRVQWNTTEIPEMAPLTRGDSTYDKSCISDRKSHTSG